MVSGGARFLGGGAYCIDRDFCKFFFSSLTGGDVWMPADLVAGFVLE